MRQNLLVVLIKQRYTISEIAKICDTSKSNVRYWLRKFKLKTYNSKKIRHYNCKFCGETKKENFEKRGGGLFRYSRCKKCANQYTIDKFRKQKLQAIAYKGGCCCICGYKKCAGSLHFHHVDPLHKDPNWRRMRNWKFDRIKDELDKCILLCANCHGEKHWNVDR